VNSTALPSAALRALGALVAPAGARARLSTLIFHRVLDEPDPLHPGEVTRDDFKRVLSWVREQYNVISSADAVAGLKSGRLPARPLVITFDDGYADNHDLAAPILLEMGLPATFFVASGYLDGGRMFNDTVAAAVGECSAKELDLTALELGRYALLTTEDRRRALSKILTQVKALPVDRRTDVTEKIARAAKVVAPEALMMTSGQVASLHRSGFEIGGHTWMHPILARLDGSAARAEIQKGRQRLEEIIGSKVRFFAYPNGRPGEDFTPQTVALVREVGFEAAFTTTPGVAVGGSDLFQLPRFTPWDRSRIRFGARMLRNMLNGNPRTAQSARQPAEEWRAA
jgi:peptidoglycan/xylan/chitin deacetylase (PgdA/CDA1 family)